MSMSELSERDGYELPAEYDFSGKEAVRGRFHSPKKVSVIIRLGEGLKLTSQAA